MTSNFKKYSAYILLVLLAPPVHLSAQGLSIGTGAAVVTSGNAFLVLNNCGFNNDGGFTAGTGTVRFNGSSATSSSFISGDSTTVFYRLELNKSANGLQLNQHCTIEDQLTLLNGDSLFLNNFIIDLTGSAVVAGESGTRKITGLNGGYIQGTYLLNSPATANPGNLGLYITSGSNLGNTVVRRGHVPQTNGVNYSIARYYDIIPTNNSGLNATIRFSYQESELNGITETSLIPFYSSDNGITWHISDYTIFDVAQNYIEQSGFETLHRITLASTSAPLPVNQLVLSAAVSGKQNIISWSTDRETNLRHFEIERSGPELHFIKIGTAGAKSNTVNRSWYTFTDGSPLPGINYYRLKVVDQNGKSTNTQTVTVKQAAAIEGVSVFPNPAQYALHISYSAAASGTCLIRITDMAGKIVSENKIYLLKGVNAVNHTISNLPEGMYILQLVPESATSSTFMFHKH